MNTKYQHIEDFLGDRSFCDWAVQKDSLHNEFWGKFLEAHPDLSTEIEMAKLVLIEISKDKVVWEEEDKAITKSKIMGRIQGGAEAKVVKPNFNKEGNDFTKNTGGWVKAAIISFLVVSSALAAWFSVEETPQVSSEKPLKWIVRSNPVGQKSLVNLPDGSKVNLNASSSLKYNSDFGKNHRELFLSGEAFFEVVRDSLKPFSVVSGDLVTTALGTSFSVTAFEGDHPSVKLATGHVVVMKEQLLEEEKIYLDPGEEALINEDDEMVKRNFDQSSAFLWKDGVLNFDKTPFSEVEKILERWYGVEILVQDMPKNLPSLVSGRFEKDNLENVLKSLGYSLRFSFEINKKEVLIKFNNPKYN